MEKEIKKIPFRTFVEFERDKLPREKRIMFHSNFNEEMFEEENDLKIIKTKKAKFDEFLLYKKSRDSLYGILAGKLEEDLKKIKNHNTPSAKEKLILLDKCRNEKHIRAKTKPVLFEQIGPEKTQNSFYSILKRPLTCPIQRKTINEKKYETQRSFNKENLQESSKSCFMVKNELEIILEKCLIEENRSQEIKEDLSAVHFYNKMIGKNVSSIFNKIL